ncbi:MAG: GDP-mannose 4,6-dehydratase [Micavibrio aeruginosavorus]|nr:GDP-mannose 4,6-dehydratase [Micavibrio aeruginosavorus]
MGVTGKVALITGVTGQDGAYLARFLLDRGYAVHGLRPYAATDDCERLRGGLLDRPGFHLHHGDLADSGNLIRMLQATKPDEIYNLGAQSHVAVSFDVPEQTADVNALGTLRLLEAIRALNMQDKARFYQASSSEMFGNAPAPQDENTPFSPCSPYAAAKLYAYWITRTYRQAYGVFACNGILFNHESPLRGAEFVTRKIARAVARGESLALGNLDACRDWGHARDYVRGMWMMLQQDAPDDFVLATGKNHSVRDFVVAAFAHAGTTVTWSGDGLAEKGICARSGKTLVTVDPRFFRPAELHSLRGNPAKARERLGWVPEHTFETLVAEMVDAEADLMRGGRHDVLAAE